MRLASCLGVEDVESPLMRQARAAWRQWCAVEPDLGVVDDLRDLPAWTSRATPRDKDDLLARLATRATREPLAASALSWLLVPGATVLANELRDLSPDFDAIVAGHLWLTITDRHAATGRGVARAILNDTRRQVLAELGVCEHARRHDRAWAATVTLDRLDGLAPTIEDDTGCADPEAELADLLDAAVCAEAVTVAERGLLVDLAAAACEAGAPLRRGRAGLTSPAVAQHVSRGWAVSGRTLRRRTVEILERLTEYAHARADDALLAAWDAAHPWDISHVFEEDIWFFEHAARCGVDIEPLGCIDLSKHTTDTGLAKAG